MLSFEDWENLCRRCGLCCYEKTVTDDGRVCLTNTPCRYLDTETRQCRVYPHRFEQEPDCLPLTEERIREVDWLPLRCGYRSFRASVKNNTP